MLALTVMHRITSLAINPSKKRKATLSTGKEDIAMQIKQGKLNCNFNFHWHALIQKTIDEGKVEVDWQGLRMIECRWFDTASTPQLLFYKDLYDLAVFDWTEAMWFTYWTDNKGSRSIILADQTTKESLHFFWASEASAIWNKIPIHLLTVHLVRPSFDFILCWIRLTPAS